MGDRTNVYLCFVACTLSYMEVAFAVTVLVGVVYHEEIVYATLLLCCCAGFLTYRFVVAVRRLTQTSRAR